MVWNRKEWNGIVRCDGPWRSERAGQGETVVVNGKQVAKAEDLKGKVER